MIFNNSFRDNEMYRKQSSKSKPISKFTIDGFAPKYSHLKIPATQACEHKHQNNDQPFPQTNDNQRLKETQQQQQQQ